MADLQVKFSRSRVTDDGRFYGYGAVFGNVDSHRDVIERGAFAASLKQWEARGRLPPMRLQHGSAGNPFRHDDLPIGVWETMKEDGVGLWCEGRLLALDTDQGKRLLSLMKAGVLDGLSIGYRVDKSRAGTGGVGRFLTAISLREISLVDEPSNDRARVGTANSYEGSAARLADAIRKLA